MPELDIPPPRYECDLDVFYLGPERRRIKRFVTAVGRGVGKAITDTVTAIVSLIVMVSFVAAVLFLPLLWMFGIDWAANR